jgi:hemerythrin-like domain-containing protein
MSKVGAKANGSGQGRAPSACPLQAIAREHRLQACQCDALERIADGLPDEFDRAAVASLLPALRRDLSAHVDDEERGLFPLLRRRAHLEDNLESILVQLAEEHAADLEYAEEVIAQLEEVVRLGRVPNPDMLGYMLRGFFQAQRRHLMWEDAVLLPLARLRLSAADLKKLAAVMLENRARASGRSPPGDG